ncbi:RNA polymerase sporulation sigma factor SigK [Clostridium sp. AF15-6B]|jgi:RNA polymerase sporulation-specific sigma factor|nr:RNA polymerase sporulation sigma factor SigK [Clostridium sp. AF16-25]RGH03517.1 RNA polymerase sporulation sigma factor SigK [Clostridium sp. AF15-49]RGH04779.1 RNA polymerase sporulation sigma factor SigK [Clostridium sp. AF15-6B]RHS89830.1 RNA polymerase sporulation sigma factor SigK [Clostridium sp. AM42-36]RHU88677.1 RNA polymerase sporulation sigma factor SigK [Clostridium sp. OM08-29]HCS96718.1 RNA polymerase subunit sigma-70 [Lachnospiraceae bacterium]
MQTFHHPLSPEEESYYLQKAKAGDLSARNILVEYNLRLVAHIVKKYQTGNRSTEDLISIGTIGLIKAINTYDTDKGSKLVTYASRCIENELLMRLRQERKEVREISLYEPIGTDREGNEISLMDVIRIDEEDVLLNVITSESLRNIDDLFTEVLDDREQQVIALRYGLYDNQELTQKEISNLLHISRSYVSRIEKKALLKLRSALCV